MGRGGEGYQDSGTGKEMVIGIIRASVRTWVDEGEISRSFMSVYSKVTLDKSINQTNKNLVIKKSSISELY